MMNKEDHCSCYHRKCAVGHTGKPLESTKFTLQIYLAVCLQKPTGRKNIKPCGDKETL